MGSAGTLSYQQQVVTPTAIELETEVQVTLNGNSVKTEYFINTAPLAQPQVDVITISATLPSSACYYRVTIDDHTANPVKVFSVFFDPASGMTNTQVATDLAALINAEVSNAPRVTAKTLTGADANKINIVSLLPGTNGAFTSTVECLAESSGSAISGSPISKTSTPGTGTGAIEKLCEFTASLSASASSLSTPSAPIVSLTDGGWFNGGVRRSTFGPASFTSPLSIDQVRSE